jgi:hypothetical protein
VIDNERRAEHGLRAVCAATGVTGALAQEDAGTCFRDALAYIAHAAVACGMEPDFLFAQALESHSGDMEDGPEAERRWSDDESMAAIAIEVFARSRSGDEYARIVP